MRSKPRSASATAGLTLARSRHAIFRGALKCINRGDFTGKARASRLRFIYNWMVVIIWIAAMRATLGDSFSDLASNFCCPVEQKSHVGCLHCDIRHLAVCGALDPKSLRELQRRVQHVLFERGQTIVMEQEPAAFDFIVHSGAVSLYKEIPDGRRQIVVFLLPGDFIGFACDDGRYCHSAEAVTRSELCRLPAGYLRQLARQHPKIQDRLMGALSAELCAKREQLLWVGRKSALEKVASFLLMLARRGEHRGRRANDVRLPIEPAADRRLPRHDRSLGHAEPRPAGEERPDLDPAATRDHHPAPRAARRDRRRPRGCGRPPPAPRLYHFRFRWIHSRSDRGNWRLRLVSIGRRAGRWRLKAPPSPAHRRRRAPSMSAAGGRKPATRRAKSGSFGYLEPPHHLVILMGQNMTVPNPLTADLVEGGDDARHRTRWHLHGVLPAILLRRGWLRLTTQWWRVGARRPQISPR